MTSEEIDRLTLIINAAEIVKKSPTYSDTVTILRVPWKLKLVSKEIGNREDKASKGMIGLFIQCKPETSEWSALAKVTIQVKNNDSAKDLVRFFYYTFSKSSNDWGYSCFMTLSSVLDPKEGFVQEGKLTVETLIEAQDIENESDNRIPAVTVGGFNSFLVCPKCDKDFEVEGEVMPMSLSCGHTFCLKCLKEELAKSVDSKSLTCSKCQHLHTRSGIKTELWYPNQSMIHIITNVMSKSEFYCREHQLDKDYYCFDDKALVCIACAYHQTRHATHSCKQVDEAMKYLCKIAKSKELSVSSCVTDVDRRLQLKKDEVEMLKTQETNVCKIVEDSCDQLLLSIDKQKEFLCNDFTVQILDLYGSMQECAM